VVDKHFPLSLLLGYKTVKERGKEGFFVVNSKKTGELMIDKNAPVYCDIKCSGEGFTTPSRVVAGEIELNLFYPLPIHFSNNQTDSIKGKLFAHDRNGPQGLKDITGQGGHMLF